MLILNSFGASSFFCRLCFLFTFSVSIIVIVGFIQIFHYFFFLLSPLNKFWFFSKYTGYFTVYFNGESLVETVDQLISFLLVFLHFIVFQVVFQWPWTYIVDSWWIKFAWIECKAFLNLNHANSIHQTKKFHLKLLRKYMKT